MGTFNRWCCRLRRSIDYWSIIGLYDDAEPETGGESSRRMNGEPSYSVTDP